MFCADVRDETSISDVVECEKRGWRADDKKPLQGEESETVGAVFGCVSKEEAKCFDYKRTLDQRTVENSERRLPYRMNLLADIMPTKLSTL